MTTLSLGEAANDLCSVIRRDRALRLQHCQQLVGLVAQELHRPARLDIEPYQGLGIRAAQIEAPIRELEGDPVGTIQDDGLLGIACFEGRDGRRGIGDPKIELAADRKQADTLTHQLGKRGRRPAARRRGSSQNAPKVLGATSPDCGWCRCRTHGRWSRAKRRSPDRWPSYWRAR